MDQNQIKQERAKAKGLFTRKTKDLARALENNSDVEIIQSRMEELKRVYSAAQEKHAEYMTSLDITEENEHYEEEDEWITGLDTAFDDLEQRKVAYVRGKNTVTPETDQRPAGVDQSDNLEKQYLSMRKIEEIAFNTLHESVTKNIERQMDVDEPLVDVINEELNEACKQAHHKYISALPNASEEVIQWVKPFQDKVTELRTKFSTLLQKKVDAKQEGITT